MKKKPGLFFEEYFKLPEVPQGRKEATKAVRLIDVMGFYQKKYRDIPDALYGRGLFRL